MTPADAPDPLALPEPFGAVVPVRQEHQRWERPGVASGEIEIGYAPDDRIVRVAYRWHRRLVAPDGTPRPVTTAELWARRPDGAWLYLVRPGEAGVRTVPHAPLWGLLVRHLNVDIGPEDA